MENIEQTANTGVSTVLFFGAILIAIILTAIITTFIVGRKRKTKDNTL